MKGSRGGSLYANPFTTWGAVTLRSTRERQGGGYIFTEAVGSFPMKSHHDKWNVHIRNDLWMRWSMTVSVGMWQTVSTRQHKLCSWESSLSLSSSWHSHTDAQTRKHTSLLYCPTLPPPPLLLPPANMLHVTWLTSRFTSFSVFISVMLGVKSEGDKLNPALTQHQHNKRRLANQTSFPPWGELWLVRLSQHGRIWLAAAGRHTGVFEMQNAGILTPVQSSFNVCKIYF